MPLRQEEQQLHLNPVQIVNSQNDGHFEYQGNHLIQIQQGLATNGLRNPGGDTQNDFKGDLIRFVQITLIIVLLLYIFVMAYSIAKQVSRFWISRDVVHSSSVSQSYLNQNAINSQLGIIEPQQSLNVADSKQLVEENQRKKQSNVQVYVGKLNLQIESKESLIQQHIQNDKEEPIQLKNQILKRPENLEASARQFTVSQLQRRYSYNEQQKKIIQHTKLPDVSDQQLFDPVLVQLRKVRKRYGQNNKQTIYTALNTSINYQQYQRANKLTQITKFYSPKQNKFIVQKQNNDPSCTISGVSCSQKQRYIDALVRQQVKYFEEKYKQPFKQTKTELPFCIIVPSFQNNRNGNIIKNINSILQQNYVNFHIVYIDDASHDGTAQTIREYILKNQIKQEKFQFIENQQNQKALKNIFEAAHNSCRQKEIMMIVDGDDYLIGTHVLRFLNYQYQKKKLLAAYTNYLRVNQPYYVKVGTSSPYASSIISRAMFRSYPKQFKASHLRSYFVDLFRKIKPEDLKDENGQFFTAANDFAIMMPIMQMASPHLQYLPQLCYVYDSGTGINNFQSKKLMQAQNVQLVSKRPRYSPAHINQFFPIEDGKT